MHVSDPFLDEMEAAEYLHVSVHTLRNCRRSDRKIDGPRYTKIGVSVRYRRSTLDSYVEQHAVEGAA